MYDYYSDDIYDDVDDFLAHHGVKGMKWGVRRARRSSGGSRSKGSSKSVKARAKRAVNNGKAWVSKHKKLLAGIGVGLGAAALAGVGAATYAYGKKQPVPKMNKISKAFYEAESGRRKAKNRQWEKEQATRFPGLTPNGGGYREGNKINAATRAARAARHKAENRQWEKEQAMRFPGLTPNIGGYREGNKATEAIRRARDESSDFPHSNPTYQKMWQQYQRDAKTVDRQINRPYKKAENRQWEKEQAMRFPGLTPNRGGYREGNKAVAEARTRRKTKKIK